MLNNVYRLTGIQQIERITTNIDISSPDMVVVRPILMSICRADERYYTGSRDAQILAKKLPMALIHEAVGEVVRDNSSTFKKGDRVALIPNESQQHDSLVPDNYLSTSLFHSSSMDGFMSEYLLLSPENLVSIPKSIQVDMNGYLEVVSVAVEAIKRLNQVKLNESNSLGIWGDGNVAYITASIAKEMLPDAEIFVFGKHQNKLDYISFAKTYLIDNIPEDLMIDNAIEAVGGRGSESSINQIIQILKPLGTIVLAGVSEEPVALNTRTILEKGLNLVGTTRSNREDFILALKLIENSPSLKKRLELMVQDIVEVHEISDINRAFDEDLTRDWGKTVLRWYM